MFHRHLISSLLAGVALFAASSAAQACACPCEAPACAAPAPCFKTITVTEWVPTTCTGTRTVYKTVYANETYTAYKTICVPEVRTCTCTVNKLVPEWVEKCRTCYKCVPTTECRTIMKKHTVCKEVTTCKKKWHTEVHCEKCCYEKGPSILDRARQCCDPCYCPCPRHGTRTKVHVNRWCEEVPCTKTVKETICVPETITVCVNKMVPYTETYKVCVHKCVSECVTKSYTVNVSKCVPYEATRCVAKCVPSQETYTYCKLVPVTTCKQVPVCEPCCETKCKKRWSFGSGCCK